MSLAVELDPDSRVALCEREIAAAVDESQKPHTLSEHLGILLWEMDWRSELESVGYPNARNEDQSLPPPLKHPDPVRRRR